jgi:hypothetical protein
MGSQALLWFGIAGGAVIFAVSLLIDRYVRKSPRAIGSRGGFTLFAMFMMVFALGALAAGIASWRAGR